MWNKPIRLYALLAVLALQMPNTPWASGQTPPATAPKPPTLASVLAGVPPPVTVLLAVGAERVSLPKDAALPPALSSADDIALAFGYKTQTFGTVTALAPATMVVLNEDPAPPNVAADLAPGVAFKLLAASLDDAQWHALTSETGLGLGDLTDDAQRSLFHALFRDKQLLVASDDPALAKLPEGKRTDIQDFTNQIDSVHMRMGQTSKIYVHDRKGGTVFFSGDDPDKTPILHVYRPKSDAPGGEHAVLLRAVVPNVPKPGQLNLALPALQTPIPVTGLRTVGSLVLRVGTLTHTELYADPHYAKRALTVMGHASSTRAADLLRALALCVTGTFRQVGQAFVLTDDLDGVGARRAKLSDWEDKARALQSQMTDKAGQALLAKHGKEARFVPSFGDPMALTPDQINAETLSKGVPGIPDYLENRMPFAQLTPAQQADAKRIANDFNDKRAAGNLPRYLASDNHPPADLSSSVSLMPENHVQFIVPSLSTPVETSFGEGGMMFFYWPGDDVFTANYHEADKAKPAAPAKPAPPLAALLRMGKRRALIAHARNAADIDALLPAMQKLGLNELWLDVFSGGEARIPGTSLSPSVPFAGPDILTEALRLGTAAHIAVYADMDLLTWGTHPPAALADLNIRGENTTEAALRKHADTPDTQFDDSGKPVPFVTPDVDVNPVAAREALLGVVQTLAATPGLAGFVWHGAAPDDLGYTQALRLAFLRARHADPIDLDPTQYTRADLSLPAFDDAAAGSALSNQWAAFRTAQTLVTLRRLREAAASAPSLGPSVSHSALPLLMEQNIDNINWLASWDDPRAMPPPLRDVSPDNPYPARARVPAIARRQGRAVLLSIDSDYAANTDTLARSLKDTPPGAPWDGYVLDLGGDDATRGAHPLDVLLHAVQPPRP